MLRSKDKRLFVGAGLRDISRGGYPEYGHAYGGWLQLILADDPSMAWNMQVASGNPDDLSGNGFAVASVNGTPTYEVAGPDQLGGNAISLENTEQFLRSGDLTNVTDNLTLELVLKRLGAVTNSQSVFSIGSNSTSGFAVLWDGTSGGFKGLLGNIAILGGSTATVGTTNFHLLHMIRRSNAWEYWLDGVADNLGVSSLSPGNPDADVRLGRSDQNVNATFAWVAFYETPLTQERIELRAEALGL